MFRALCFAAQTPGPARGPARAGRPALFFREEWKPGTGGAEAPVNPAEAVANPSLELKLYGPGGKDIQLPVSRRVTAILSTSGPDFARESALRRSVTRATMSI